MVVRSSFPNTVREEAQMVKDAWDQMQEQEFGRVQKDQFHQHIYEYDLIDAEIKQLENQLRALRTKRKDAGRVVWEDVKNVRDSVGGQYGRDSVEYHRFGRTRTSERRPSSTKKNDGNAAKKDDKTATTTTTDTAATDTPDKNTTDTG